ncbi:hypothetical protein FRC08_005392 [Ceratobasidium sp. 394]|nr:hypothetical protein FRC08_005392 [Ceratobasidium sp. 394]
MASATMDQDLIDPTHVRPCLPAEIFDLVFSHARRGSQAAAARTSHLLFDLAIPHLWRDVDVVIVLGLLYGSYYEGASNPASFQVEIPRVLPDDYFARLNIYAPHVSILRFSHRWYVAKDYSHHRFARPAIARHAADQALLPNLKALFLTGSGSLDRHLDVLLDWISALVLPGKKLVHCTFDLQPTSASSAERARDILNKLILFSDTLTSLTLNSYPLWDMALPIDLGHFPLHVPQALTHLSIASNLLARPSLAWISNMSKLSTLQISSPGLTVKQVQRVSSVVLPPDSFQALRCLEVNVYVDAAFHLWQTPMVTHLTKAVICGGMNGSTKELFALIAKKNPNLHALELRIYFPKGIEPYILDPLRSLELSALSILNSPMDGIHAIQTIGKMWPTLEVLDLGFTVIDLLDLLCVSKSLPKLKRLSMSLPTKISGEVRKLAEKPYTPANFETWRTCSPFTLVSDMGWAGRIQGLDIDFLAWVLATACPKMKLEFSFEIPTAKSIGVSLQERVSYHSRKLLSLASPEDQNGTGQLPRDDEDDEVEETQIGSLLE